MSLKTIIAAWKDPEVREGLSDAERALLPESPAGDLALDDALLDRIAGGEPAPPTPRH